MQVNAKGLNSFKEKSQFKTNLTVLNTFKFVDACR